jgi:phospholipid/cholesterol/gamma-HCH transport system substrate-binding protein
VGQLVSEPFDHARPLWQLYVIEGLKDRRVAVMFKLHHAVVDGISGLDLHTMLFDQSPAGRNVLAPRDQVCGAPSRRQLLARGLPQHQAVCAVGNQPLVRRPEPDTKLSCAGRALRPAGGSRQGDTGASVNNGMNPIPADLLPQPPPPRSDPLSRPGQGAVQCSGPQPNPCVYIPTPGPAAICTPQSGQVVAPDGTKFNVSNSANIGDDGWKEMLASTS